MNQGLLTLEKSFRNEIEKNPTSSSFICYGRTVKGKKLSESVIGRGFRKLVNKDDYSHSDIDRLIMHFHKLSNQSISSEITA